MLWEERMAAEAAAAGNEDGVRYWNAIKACVDQAPPFTEEQKSRLRILLRQPQSQDFAPGHPAPAADPTATPSKRLAGPTTTAPPQAA